MSKNIESGLSTINSQAKKNYHFCMEELEAAD